MLRGIVEEALSTGERRLVVISGDDSPELASELAGIWLSMRKGRVLVVTHMGVNLDRISVDEGELTSIDFDQTEEVLGGTWDLLIADLSVQFRANDIGRLLEVVRGGGLAILTVPRLEDWLSSLTEFQRKFLVPPFEGRQMRQLFKRRFLSSLGAKGTFLLGESTKGELCGRVSEERKPLERAGDPVLDLCATNDQQRVLRSIIEAFRERKRAFILTANRGRGKSAAIGLALSLIMTRSKVRSAVVTSPSLEGIQTIFSFLMKGLEAQGVSYEPLIRDGRVIDLRFKGKNVFYLTPESAAEVDVSLKVVDEAASIPVNTLFQFLSTSKFALFSSTVHGYEGAGRGFTLRFLRRVRRSGIAYAEGRMEEPVRYPPGDPVERWLYDFLLLDAEPGEPPKDLENLNYRRISLHDVDEGYLRKFYGIYVLAHYRNRPNDLATLLDAPHHFARALEAGGEPVVSMHVAEEGGLPAHLLDDVMRGMRDLPGHLIPSRLVLHYCFKTFGKLRGWRVVRIATHPELQGKGLGTRALSELEEEARESGVDWIGAGFGATEELLRFWVRSGYLTVHISPSRNPVTGEYSVLVMKPLSSEASKLSEEILREFKRRLLSSLHDVYFSLNPSVARLLLKGRLEGGKVKLSNSQRSRLGGYLRGTYVYELASDSIYEVVRGYFWQGLDCLTPREESMLIAKVLQGKPWETIRSRFGIKEPYEVMREIVFNLVRCLDSLSDQA
ncbi:MAG: GNAT family N-acetyltransferase [Candidatus Korarchaeum sp.]